MIPSNELRIGNWVTSEEYGDFQIKSMSIGFEKDMVFKSTEYYPQAISCERIDPIILTAEWMERFEFEKQILIVFF